MSDIPMVTLNNGVRMPQLGLGVFRVPEDQTAPTVATALASGYRLIDTAAGYGNEEGVGEAVRRSGIPRSEVFVATKLANSDHGYDNAMRGFEASLQKLGMDYVDLYLVHWPLPRKGLTTETWRAFEKIYKDGRAKAIGVSNFTPAHLERLANETDVTPAVLQIELNPAFAQPGVRQYAKDHGIQVESWAPIGGQRSVQTMLKAPALTSIASAHGKTPAQVVLRWHIQLGLVAIPKSTHADRIRENRDIFDFQLSQAEMDAISGLNTGVRLGPDPDAFGA